VTRHMGPTHWSRNAHYYFCS